MSSLHHPQSAFRTTLLPAPGMASTSSRGPTGRCPSRPRCTQRHIRTTNSATGRYFSRWSSVNGGPNRSARSSVPRSPHAATSSASAAGVTSAKGPSSAPATGAATGAAAAAAAAAAVAAAGSRGSSSGAPPAGGPRLMASICSASAALDTRRSSTLAFPSCPAPRIPSPTPTKGALETSKCCSRAGVPRPARRSASTATVIASSSRVRTWWCARSLVAWSAAAPSSGPGA